MFQYSEHQGCWSKQNTRLIWPLRNSFKFKPVDESSRRKVSLSVGTEGPKMLPRRLFHSDLATHSDGWCSTVELVKPDANTCDMIHQNHMNISSWSMLQFVVWLLIWWHLWHPASSFFIHKSWNPQAPAAYFVGHPPLRHMPPGRKKGKWAHKFEDRKSICPAIDRSPAYTVHSDCKQDSNSSQYSTALDKKSYDKSPHFSVVDLQIILLTCCQAVVKPQRWAPQVPFWTTSTQKNRYRVNEPSCFMVFYRPCHAISSKIPNFQRRLETHHFFHLSVFHSWTAAVSRRHLLRISNVHRSFGLAGIFLETSWEPESLKSKVQQITQLSGHLEDRILICRSACWKGCEMQIHQSCSSASSLAQLYSLPMALER